MRLGHLWTAVDIRQKYAGELREETTTGQFNPLRANSGPYNIRFSDDIAD